MALPVLFAAFQIGSQIAGVAAQAQAAKQQNKLNQELYQRQAGFLREAFRQNSESLFRREEAQRYQDAYTVQDVERDALNVAGRTQVQAAGSGLRGKTVDTLISLVARQELDFRTRLDSQQARRGQELAASLNALALNTSAELTSLQPNPVQGPDLLSSLFSIGNAGLGGYTSGTNLQATLAANKTP